MKRTIFGLLASVLGIVTFNVLGGYEFLATSGDPIFQLFMWVSFLFIAIGMILLLWMTVEQIVTVAFNAKDAILCPAKTCEVVKRRDFPFN